MAILNLNKIVGLLTILIIIVLVFFITTKLSVTAKEIEGPHIFYEDQFIKTTTITTQGKKITEKTENLYEKDHMQKVYEVNIPGKDKHFQFLKTQQLNVPKDNYSISSKMFVVSDIEGDFNYLENILKGNDIIDHNFNWKYGDGDLVIVGDVFDRGKYVTECLWLIYKLDYQAQQSGGQVHLLLGNHEIMALQGDHRYISKKYKRISKTLGIKYKEFFGPNTELGKWLRTKNTIETIGNTLFVHGGISIDISNINLSITEINEIIRKNIDVAPKNFTDETTKLIFGTNGPLWYRGYLNKSLSQSQITNITNQYNVDNIVIGHTMVNDVTSIYNNKVFAIDVSRKAKKYTALLFENGMPYIIDSNAIKTKL